MTSRAARIRFSGRNRAKDLTMTQEQKKQAVILVILVSVLCIVGFKTFGGGGSAPAPPPAPAANANAVANAPAGEGSAPSAPGATVGAEAAGTSSRLELPTFVSEYTLVSAGTRDPFSVAPQRGSLVRGSADDLTLKRVRDFGQGWRVSFDQAEVRGMYKVGDEFEFKAITYSIQSITRSVVTLENVVTGATREVKRRGAR